MRGDLLSVFERATVLQIGGNPGRSERMAAGGVGQRGCFGPSLDHIEHVAAYHGIAGQIVALFEAYGVLPLRDFPNPAPEFPTRAHPGLRLTVYIPSFLVGMERPDFICGALASSHGHSGSLRSRSSDLARLASFGTCRASQARMKRCRAWRRNARARLGPILDALFQTSIRGLYIVSEAAGTASINLAMRSGRQVIDCITAELHRLNPPVQTDAYDVEIVGSAVIPAEILGA